MWALTYYERVHVVTRARADIQNAQSWLRAAGNLALPTVREAIDQLSVYSKLFSLSWDKPLLLEREGSPSTAHQLLPLLASTMLGNEIVDMMLGWIEGEALRRSVGTGYIIGSMMLWQKVSAADEASYFTTKGNIPRSMQQLPEQVESGKILFMPIIFAHHFVLAVIDGHRATLTFGEIIVYIFLGVYELTENSQYYR